jgi:hypothetical protein
MNKDPRFEAAHFEATHSTENIHTEAWEGLTYEETKTGYRAPEMGEISAENAVKSHEIYRGVED